MQFTGWTAFEIFEVFSFNRADNAFEFFLSNGDKIRPSFPRKLLEFCSQVPAKVQSALLHVLEV